jgi:membrane-associated phospholipid phosphatase
MPDFKDNFKSVGGYLDFWKPVAYIVGLAKPSPSWGRGSRDEKGKAFFSVTFHAKTGASDINRRAGPRRPSKHEPRDSNHGSMTMKRIAPYHGLTALFLAFLLVLTFFCRDRIPFWHSLLLRYFLYLGLLWALALTKSLKPEGGAIGFFHDYSPILFVMLIFDSLGYLVQYLRHDIDPALIRIDQALFGVHPTVWLERFIVPWLTDLLSLAYTTYYFLPIVLVTLLYVRGDRKGGERALFILLFGYYLSYVGYILFPAIGPRFTLADLQSVPLKGSFITDWVRDGLNALEKNKRDCMPSGHTQISLMVLFLAWRCDRRLFWICLPVVAGLVASTMYLRYHYVIDVAAGAALAVFCTLVGGWLFAKWDKTAGAGRSAGAS